MFLIGFGVLVILAIQLAIVGVVLWIAVQMGKVINLLGDINMKQAEFDKKVDEMAKKVDTIGSNLDSESVEINQNLSAMRDEIARLQAESGDTIDTSKLDAISASLDASATRISGLVDPVAPATPSEPSGSGETSTTPAEVVDAPVDATATPTTDTATPAETETPAPTSATGTTDEAPAAAPATVDEAPATDATDSTVPADAAPPEPGR